MWWRWFESWFPSWNLGWDRFWWMFYIASKWQGFRRNNLRFQCFRCFWTTVPGRRFNAWWQPRPMGPPPLSSRAGQTMQNMKHLVVLSRNLSLTWPLLQEWSPRGGGVSGGQVLRLRGAGFWFWTRKNYFVVNMNICEQAGSVTFDGETIEGAPPLWCAAAAGWSQCTAVLLMLVMLVMEMLMLAMEILMLVMESIAMFLQATWK